MERIVCEEKFIKEETAQIDQCLRRCKTLANMMVTMKKLAMVQDPTLNTLKFKLEKNNNNSNSNSNNNNNNNSNRILFTLKENEFTSNPTTNYLQNDNQIINENGRNEKLEMIDEKMMNEEKLSLSPPVIPPPPLYYEGDYWVFFFFFFGC